MNTTVEDEIEKFKECLKSYGAKTVHLLLSAFLIWLFGNLVFIPLATSLSGEVKTVNSLIFFVAFTVLILKALPGLKKLIDAFSVFPARKYFVKRGLNYSESLVVSRQVSYIISIVIFYLLYFPFLANFHPAISGIVLIVVIIWIFFSALQILLISSRKIFEWMQS